jgi:hypothetical protein
LTKSGDQFAVTVAVFNPDLDLNRARYECLDVGGAVIVAPFDVDFVQAIRESHLVRGQSFAVTQRFMGASTHPEVAGVRVTIFDGETNATSPAVTPGASATSVAAQSRRAARLRPVVPPAAHMDWPQR